MNDALLLLGLNTKRIIDNENDEEEKIILNLAILNFIKASSHGEKM